ncbi:MAG: CCA tRNA nucleotidyltransferase [Erysipelotrichaceae bacterium]
MEINLDKGRAVIFAILQENGYEAYLVGGCVRDALLQIPFTDYDFTTNCQLDDLFALFNDYKLVCHNPYLCSVKVYINDKEYQITTYRQEDQYNDFRHPSKVVVGAKIQDDLVRRDFTINSLAYNPHTGIIDLFNGLDDLNKKIIRTIDDPYLRFKQDPLRILRALRFSSKLNFTIEPKTSIALKDECQLIKHLSKQRIIAEFDQIIQNEYLKKVFIDYKEVFCQIFEQLRYVNDSLYKTRIRTISQAKNDLAIRLAMFYQMFDNYSELLQLYHYPKKMTEKISFLIDNCHLFVSIDEISLKKSLKQFGQANLNDLMLFQKEMALIDEAYYTCYLKNVNELITQKKCYNLADLQLKGNDLIGLGYQPRQIGDILNSLLDKVIENQLDNNKTDLLNELKKKNH